MKFDMVDYNGDEKLDLVVFKLNSKDTKNINVSVLDGVNDYKTELFNENTGLTIERDKQADCVLKLKDYNKDGILDLICIKKTESEAEKVDIMILFGGHKFVRLDLSKTITLSESASNSKWDFTFGDYNSDGRVDIAAIQKSNTKSGRTEIVVLDGSKEFTSTIGTKTTTGITIPVSAKVLTY